MPGVQGQERDAAEAGDDEPRYRGPQHEGAGGAVRQVSLNFYKHESSKFIHITTYMKNALHSVSECGFEIPKTYQAPAHIWDLPR